MKLKENFQSKKWYLYKSRHFRHIKGKEKLKKGALLYSRGEFYILVDNNRLKPISDASARKIIYNTVKKSMKYSDMKVLQQHLDFIFSIDDIGDIELTLFPSRPASIPFPSRATRTQRSTFSTESELKARTYFHEAVQKYDRLYLFGNILYIYSINKNVYHIYLGNGQVYNFHHSSICVRIKRPLPHYDTILAKALTIAYRPELIGTL